jgi:hypothetical protein
MSKTNPTKIDSIDDLFSLAGSVQQIAADLNKHQRTIERWREKGVPEEYHIRLNELYGVTPIDLYKLSLKIRGFKVAA